MSLFFQSRTGPRRPRLTPRHRGGPLALAFCFAWAAITAFALNPSELPQDYIATHWDTETGLPHNAVKKVFQTRDGYLWVGTLQGLARFDGITFTVFNQHNTPTILNSQITSFAETADGSLWIGTSYGLTRYKDGTFKTYTEADGLKSATGTVNAVCVAPDQSLWIGSQNGITRWVDGKFVQDIDTSAYNTLGLRSITVDSRHTIWISSGPEVLRYRGGKFTEFTPRQGLPGQAVQTVAEDPAGNAVAVTQNGLFRLENERFVPYELNSQMSNQRAGVALADRAGNFWIGSLAGVDRIAHGAVAPYRDRFGNSPGVVDAIFEDREECLWLGTANGLYRLTNRRGHSLAINGRVLSGLGTAVRQTRDGATWVALWGSGVDRIAGNAVTHFGAGTLSHESITHIYEAPDGIMWLGTRGSAVDRLENNKVTTYVYESGVATSRPVTAVFTDPSGELLIGISKRGLLHLVNGKITPVPGMEALARETIWTINRLQNGDIVMGTTKGLFRRTADGKWTPIEVRGLPAPIVARAMWESTDGTIWLATDGRGLVRWHQGEGHGYDTRRGMVDDTLYSVLEDDLGSLWVSSARGIARVRISDLDELDRGAAASVSCMTFGREDGLLSGSTAGNGSPAAVRLKDGRIMTATDSGIAVLDPRAIQTNGRPPTVVIERAVADDREIPVTTKLTIPPGTNRLELRYTALSLVSPQRLRFRYQLKGSDPAWVEAGHARIATYTHLSPGDYTFSVLACNNDGVWSDVGAVLAVQIEPRFFQTLWFRILAGAAGLALLASVLGLRVRQFKLKQLALARTNAELDQRVRERTAELSRSNQELAQRESLFRLIFEHAPVGISWHRTDLGPTNHLNTAFRQILGLPSQSLAGITDVTALVHPEDAVRQAELEAEIASGKSDSYTIEQRFVRLDGTPVYGLFAKAVVRDEQGRVIQVIGILEDISARKLAEQELAKTYKRLMDVSRVSGMAEVATGVLHNVGNVLNSVNVSVSMLADGLRQSRVGGLGRLAAMLQEHATTLATFLTEDPRGQRVLPYLTTLAGHLQSDHERLLGEIESLRANVEHIKEIVARQQNLAQQGGLLERVAASELLDDALEMNAMALARHNIELVREIETTPLLVTERHKVLQILINLIQNAKEALKSGRPNERRLVVRIRSTPNHVRFEVIDNGVGIERENLTKIFEHGFTTRANGHGFGLHSSAIAAKQLNGTLTAHSDGVGQGATFVLEIPLTQPNAVQAANGATIPAGTPISAGH